MNIDLILDYPIILIDFILSGSTKYYEPLSCGVRSCDFGATCIKSDCLCEFDCQNGDSYYKEPVCGNDGNTYRTECQLRQYSCRIQKTIIIVKYEPCTGKFIQEPITSKNFNFPAKNYIHLIKKCDNERTRGLRVFLQIICLNYVKKKLVHILK